MFRTFFFLPAVILALIVVPSIAFSMGNGSSADGPSQNWKYSPLPPGHHGTVPWPKPRPTRRPYPRATPTRVYVAPTPTAVATPVSYPPGTMLIQGERMTKIIGDRASSVLYAFTTGARLYRSNNDGASWRLVTTNVPVDDFVMSPADPDVLYSGKGVACEGIPQEDQPLYKSVDGGVNWSQVPGADNLRPLLANQVDADVLFAADCDGPYVTTDGGTSWESRIDTSDDNLWTTYKVVEMAAPVADNPTTADGAWEQIFIGGLAKDGSGVVAFTSDLGETWVRLTPNVYPASWGLNALAVDASTAGLVLFSEPKSVWQSLNYGVNWQTTSKGLEPVVDNGLPGGPFGLHDLTYHPDGQIYLGTVRGLYTKVLNGPIWAKVTDRNLANLDITGLLFTDSNPSVLWLNTTTGVFVYDGE